jgi:DNA-binding NarL/FixJ family response regulator
LSKRELQVFFKLANGKSILNVANDLNISTSTVSVFRSKILKKMQFKNNADLILYAKDQHCLTEFN